MECKKIYFKISFKIQTFDTVVLSSVDATAQNLNISIQNSLEIRN